MKRTLPALGLALFVLAACKDGTGSNGGLIKLNIEPSTWYLGVGDTVRLVASGTNTKHESVSVTSGVSYKSANPGVASVTRARWLSLTR